MSSYRNVGRLLALVLAAALVPACKDKNSSGTGVSTGGGRATPLVWQNTAAVGGGAGFNSYGATLWNDPNTAPIGGGGATNITYETAGIYGPPEGLNYICYGPAQNSQTAQDEVTLEGYVSAYYSSLVQAGGAGGFGGAGGIGGIGAVGVALVPPTYTSPTLRPIARAWCRNVADPVQGAQAIDPGLPTRLQECSINWSAAANVYTGAPGMTAQQAWGSALQGPTQLWVQTTTSQGWASGGSWQGPTENWFGIVYVETPVGQTP